MNTFVRTEHAAGFVAGVVTVLAVGRIVGWWLDTGLGVGVMMGVLFVLGFAAGCLGVAERRPRAIAVWTGSAVGMAVQLFVRGPGTIWPLVLTVGAVMAAVAVLAGTAVASMFDGQRDR